MAESMILSAIERLDSWQHKKPDFFEESYLKLRSLLVGKADPCNPLVQIADFREDIKKKLYSVLVDKDYGEDNMEKAYTMINEMADFGEDNMVKMYNLPRHLLEEYKEKLDGLLVGMADFKEDNKEKMKSLLVGMADFWEDNNKEKLYSLLVWVAVLPDSGLYKNKRIVNNKKNVYSLLVEMADLWDEFENDKLKLHTLLLEITGLRVEKYMIKCYNKELYEEKVYSLMADIAGLCKNVKGKLNKVKVHSWLAKKVDLWEHSKLFRLLLDIAFYHDVDMYINRDMVERIKGELRSILDFLRDKKWEEGSRLHYFVSDALEMAHDAQLLIDVRDSDPFTIFLIFNREDYRFIRENVNRFENEIRGIQNWIQETKWRMLQFGVERAITKSENVGGGGQDTVVVGLEEDIKLLLGIKNKHTIIIRGMAGSGKTTLARILYNHADVVKEFECRAWVCVSWESSRKEILIQLIRQLVDTKEFERDVGSLEIMDNKWLQQMLHQHLQGIGYFIILDDVWEKTFLEYVMKALPKGEESRLVLTTRSADINCVFGLGYDHNMKYLDDYESWQLFLKTVFFGTSTDQEFPKHLEKRGRKMLTRCNGLPLAIKEVGRQWAKKVQSEWEELVESIDLSETLVALESSYHTLDSQLKSCFLHLSFFKEGTTIRSKKLEDIWIVGGVVSAKQKYSRNIISELAKASIIEETPQKGRKTCRLNAVFHKLSIKKAEDEMRLEILRNDGNNRVSDNPPCHRVIYCSREKFIFSTNQNNNHLVSLLFHGGGYFDDSPSYWKHFEQLKILDMEDFGVKILPDAVGTLIELRYLGLRNNYIQELPRSLGQLKNLEVLDIAQNFMMEVPDIVWEIGSLQHLYMSDIICQKPLKIDVLKNLETLTYISVDNWMCELSDLEIWYDLYKLGIEELDRNSDVSKLFASLAKLNYLGHLILRGFRYRSMPSLDELGILQKLNQLKLEGRLTRLPSANNFPPDLQFLTLVNSSLDEDPMPILEKLPIEYLKLQNAYTGQQMVISSDGFLMISQLVLGELWNLRKVQVGKGAMPGLSQLDINSCPYLETPPLRYYAERLTKEIEHGDYKNNAKKIQSL